MYGFDQPWALALLPLALLPFVLRGQATVNYSSLGMLPPDRLSDALDWFLRLVTAACVVAIALGVAGLFRAEEAVERIGRGAQTVILLDSSGSMDTIFASGNEGRGRAAVWGTYTSKGQVARQLLAKWAAQRQQDMFALFVFSGNPIPVLELTDKQDVIQAAIAAGAIERGLASTDLANGLIRSLEFFDGKPFKGSRIVLLVSDGAAHLTNPQQDQIKYLLKKHRVTLYWIYLRAKDTPGLYAEMGTDTAAKIAPEQLVHKFFSGMGLPYRAFSAENPEALQEAIAEVNALQDLPIRYVDVIPRRDLSHWCFASGMLMLFVLTAAKFAERTQWH